MSLNDVQMQIFPEKQTSTSPDDVVFRKYLFNEFWPELKCVSFNFRNLFTHALGVSGPIKQQK